ncbi:YcnI family protein [Glycomyces paridis]|uniref:YcnI family copper-binding membrane protein n=1 Tax=Glycomyces paridis TaxID=2126555 RepID=UPI0013054540|nr:YcnI family protein [Glycomyces paridis]
MHARDRLTTAARAAVFALVCAPVAAGAHVLAGGALALEPILLAAMPIAAAAYLFAKRGPRRASWLFSVFTIAQACLHSLFAQASHGHGAHGPREAAAMTLLHVVATAVAVLWVMRLEPTLPRLGERLAAALRRLLTRFRPAALPLLPSTRRAMRRRQSKTMRRRAVGAVGLRGPPRARRLSFPRRSPRRRRCRGPPEKAVSAMSRNALRRALARTGLIAAAALTAAAIAAPASAHVTISAANTVAGSYTLLTVSVPHGCEGEATTAIAIQIPEPINAVTPTVNPGWDVEKVMVDLPEPIVDAHGAEITERVDQVVYTAKTPLPDGLRDAFELSLRLPEETAGQTLHFPVVQTCGAAEHPWIEIAEEGQNPDELESPAPFIEVAAPEVTAEPTESSTEDSAAEPAAASDEGTDPVTYVALAIGMLAAGLAAFALIRGRRAA